MLAFNTKSFEPNFISSFISMSFVVIEKSICPIEHCLHWFGHPREPNLLVSFGLKFDIMFEKVSVNILPCQLGLVLMLRC